MVTRMRTRGTSRMTMTTRRIGAHRVVPVVVHRVVSVVVREGEALQAVAAVVPVRPEVDQAGR